MQDAKVVQFKSAPENFWDRLLSMPSTAPFPVDLLPFHLTTPVERRRRIRRTLIHGYLIWKKDPARGLIDSVREAGGGQAHGEYALVEVRRLLGTLNLKEWEEHPARLRAEVHSAFRRVIGRLTPHKGGWRIHAVH